MSENNPRDGYMGGRPDVLALLPESVERVLDVGCSVGELGYSIKEKYGAWVTGIEFDEEMASVARNKLDKVIVGDATEAFLQNHLKDERFDVIIFADVLEHLVDPWTTLSLAVNNLSEHGVIIASIPNIRFYNSLFNVAILGKWPYRSRGIHDRTHLRFFTLYNIRELFNQAGLVIEKQSINYRIIERPHGINRYAKYLALPGLKGFLAYQYLIRAKN
jgi:2-polyprenyl-3-methyl-5-hydroxy-6-metoxy-1,4-benzoquinol methylase